MEILGVPLIWLPRMSHPDGSGASGSGLLVPDVRISRVNGVELSFPYYLSLSQSHDLTVTPHVYTEVLPALEVEYRRMTRSEEQTSELESLMRISYAGFFLYKKKIT